MTRSDQINELAAALANAEEEMENARRDSENPHFRSQYAGLASVRKASRPLAKHGLALIQSPRLVSTGDGTWAVEVETLLLHASGQWIGDVLAVPIATPSAQAIGSGITYGRRYALAAFVGIAPAGDDDDGNAAVGDEPVRGDARVPRTKAKKAPAADGVTERIVGRVASIARRPIGDTGREKFVVRLEGGSRTFETWSNSTAVAAKTAKDAERDVELVFKPGKFGLEILQLRDVSQPEPPL